MDLALDGRFEWQCRWLSGHVAKFGRRDACLSRATRFVNGQSFMECVGFLCFAFFPPNDACYCVFCPQAANVLPGGLPGGSVLGQRQQAFPRAALQALKERQSLSIHFTSGHGGLPVCGETVLSWRDAGSMAHIRAGSQRTGQGCHWRLPLVSGPAGGRPRRRSVVLAGAALWYLKRGYPLYVHFINGEYTGGDSYLRIKL